MSTNINQETSQGDVNVMVDKFMEVQGKRAKLYNDLKVAFSRQFTEDTQESRLQYQTKLKSIGDRFSECSLTLKQMRGGQDDSNHAFFQLLERIQLLEKDKLALTLSLYSLRNALQADHFSWERRPYNPGEKDLQHIQDIISAYKMLQRVDFDNDRTQFDFISRQMACRQDGIQAISLVQHKLEEVVENINEVVYSIQDLQDQYH
eukprot:TRINITY_DN18957_c0_g1_i1.p1 TRINITY_DN18957_c0_g1~~TRINITY_DN18957_c0_g1_i1.p1  ORF type:complete len:205 (-),score=12.77 TRINITY_DN18957_c0_g1_i1:45-659(-)